MANQDCCPEQSATYVYRMVLADLDSKSSLDHLRCFPARGSAAINYKAISKRNGNNRRKTSPVSGYGIQTKARAGRQLASTIASTIIPGDLSPFRSPVRSAFWRAVTPGFGGGRGGSRPGENRGYRCPEGYQYGGRFTDSRLSTCGAKLFDIPSPIGATISALVRAGRSQVGPQTEGRAIGGEDGPSDLISRRAPQIPRVGNENRSTAKENAEKLAREIGTFNKFSNDKVRRMVRRDGFVLQPVVPNKVLRAIPDNRDMEGAILLSSALSAKDIGGEELGLLSNTGVRSLVYVLPGGSQLSISKARKLSVGERRKLGRVVNSAMEMKNESDPARRLRFVSEEIPGGIAVSESFVGVKNPNSTVSGKRKWVNDLFVNRKLQKPPKGYAAARSGEEDQPTGQKRLIKNYDNAIQHLSNGGSMTDIDPSTLAEVLAKSNLMEKQKLSNSLTAVSSSSGNYFLYERPVRHQHLAESYASYVQRALGMESPNVLFVGPGSDRRKYLREDIESVIEGGRFNPDKKFEEIDPEDVARMMIADFLTDQREREMTSIYAVDTADGTRAVLAQNTTSGLIDLSKIEITKRMKMRIEDFYGSGATPDYSDYYQKLKAEQRIMFIRFLSLLINRARQAGKSRFSKSLGPYGISAGEKIHLEIIEKLFDSRLETLSSQKQFFREFFISGENR